MGPVVALHPEGVDRNKLIADIVGNGKVALHPEGVDRNTIGYKGLVQLAQVALHPEGVDRNFSDLDNPEYWMGRPPPGGRG